MSIQSEITRINGNIGDSYTELESRGAIMPQTLNSANLATTVATMPTFETGSNANGSWIKFSDGTMICNFQRDLSANEKNFSSSYGSIYYASVDIVWTYPQAFLTNTSPTVTCSIALKGGVGAGTNLKELPTNTNSTVYAYYPRLYDFGSIPANINFIAIGKWK